MRMAPDVGSYNLARSLMIVDLPLPLAPTMTTSCPGFIDIEILFRALVLVLLPGYVNVTFLSSAL